MKNDHDWLHLRCNFYKAQQAGKGVKLTWLMSAENFQSKKDKGIKMSPHPMPKRVKQSLCKNMNNDLIINLSFWSLLPPFGAIGPSWNRDFPDTIGPDFPRLKKNTRNLATFLVLWTWILWMLFKSILTQQGFEKSTFNLVIQKAKNSRTYFTLLKHYKHATR